MKKGIKNLAIAGMVGVAAMGLMAGCEKKEDPKPYIQVAGLDVCYMAGENLNLEGAKILYYTDKNDTIADEIKLEASMIANFSTEEAGEKKMKVLWNGFELEVDYSVFTLAQFVETYNTAYNNFINAENIHVDLNVSLGSESGDFEQNINYEISNNKFYACRKNEVNGLITDIDYLWVQQDADSGDWYEYVYSGQENIKMIGTVQNDNINNYVFKKTIGVGYDELTMERLQAFENVSYEIENSQIVLSFSAEFDGQDSNMDMKLYIKDGKFVKMECCSVDGVGEGESEEMITTSTISYNAEEVHRVDLPTDIEWETR